jgi:hypothetical protein
MIKKREKSIREERIILRMRGSIMRMLIERERELIHGRELYLIAR